MQHASLAPFNGPLPPGQASGSPLQDRHLPSPGVPQVEMTQERAQFHTAVVALLQTAALLLLVLLLYCSGSGGGEVQAGGLGGTRSDGRMWLPVRRTLRSMHLMAVRAPGSVCCACMLH